jgi:galactose-1-phosphate uridylyltransferase
MDPRNGDRIVYNSRRAKRPHDNRPAEKAPEKDGTVATKSCVICNGMTTGLIDATPLSKGYTFINKNLFPILYPELPAEKAGFKSGPNTENSSGVHLLQWTSSEHESDWQNMPVDDLCIVLSRLAALEKALLQPESPDKTRYVAIIKNYGRLVGGSLEHGHQQIACTDIMPQRFRHNLQFMQTKKRKYAEFMLEKNPEELTVKEYETARLLVPYFMRRPFDMQLLMKDCSKKYLHKLNNAEIRDMAAGWSEAISAILHLMPAIGRESAYNVVVHNGPGAGIYVEFLPYTQEWGGYEQTGLILCQSNPQTVAEQLKEFFISGNKLKG